MAEIIIAFAMVSLLVAVGMWLEEGLADMASHASGLPSWTEGEPDAED